MSICFNCHKDGYYSSSCISCERCSPHSLTDLRGMTEERDRYKANLEWLVYWCLRSDDPPISIGRGKELLGFEYMDEMRAWMNQKAQEADRTRRRDDMNGCEMMRCTDYRDGMCGIDGPCKYRGDENSVLRLRKELDHYKRLADELEVKIAELEQACRIYEVDWKHEKAEAEYYKRLAEAAEEWASIMSDNHLLGDDITEADEHKQYQAFQNYHSILQER